MKFLNLLAALGLATATALPAMAETTGFKIAPKDDTVLVKLANGAKMSLIVKNTEQLKSFQNYSLDSLMIMLNKYIAEAEKMEKKDVSGKDYTVSFRPSAEETKGKKKPESIKITFKDTDDQPNAKGKSGLNIDVNYEDGESESFTIGGKKTATSDSVIYKENPRHQKFEKGWEMDLGFNTLLNTGNNTLDVVGLKPWGSRYVSINRVYQFHVGGDKSPVNFRTGLNFAFNNFMFDGNYVLKDSEENGNHYTILEKDERELEKSKLATTAINLPVMMLFDFKTRKAHTSEDIDDGIKTITTSYKEVLKIGFGGFIGYRIGAHRSE